MSLEDPAQLNYFTLAADGGFSSTNFPVQNGVIDALAVLEGITLGEPNAAIASGSLSNQPPVPPQELPEHGGVIPEPDIGLGIWF